jgi:DNA-binding MarR family transcriptional regulator
MSDVTPSELADLFLRTAKYVRHLWVRELAPFGLTPGQGRALEVLGRDGSPIRMAELAGYLGIVPRSATSVVDGLEGAGLVVRTPDQADRRSMLVSLTEHGRVLVGRIAGSRILAAEETFSGLRSEERVQLAALLQRVAESHSITTSQGGCRLQVTGELSRPE